MTAAPARARTVYVFQGRSAGVVAALLSEPDRDWTIEDVMERTGFDRSLVIRTLRGLEHQGHLLIRSISPRDLITGRGRGPSPRLRVRDAIDLGGAAVTFWHGRLSDAPAWVRLLATQREVSWRDRR